MERYHYEGVSQVRPLSLGRKTTRKVRAVEVPFGGPKRKISSGAPKWAIQVMVLLSDLFKLIKGAFHSLRLALFDLKGVVVLLFVLLILP